jgi:hypothetical protein
MPNSVSNHKLPESLVAVALVDGKTAAATGAQSISQWLQDVAAGIAPPPVIRQSRYTRWRLVDVAAYWERRAAEGTPAETRQAVIERARKGYAQRKTRQTAPDGQA